MAKVPTMSASRLKSYLNCPQQYKLRYVDNIEMEETPIPLIKGSAIHEFIEDFHDDVIIKDGQLYLNGIDYPELDEDGISHLNQMKQKDLKENIRRQCRRYVKMEKRRWKTLKQKTDSLEDAKYYFEPEIVEGKYYDDERDYVGIIDRVQRNLNGTYTIYDFKTGTIKSSKTNYRRQLAMYHHLLEVNNRLDGKIKAWGIISPKTGNIWNEEVKKKSITNLHKKIETVKKAIKNDQFECKQGFTCMYCEDLYQQKLEQGGGPTNPDGSW